MVQSEFLKDCGNEEKEYIDGAFNQQYNSWQKSCLQRLLNKYKKEYETEILQWLGLDKQNLSHSTEIQSPKASIVNDSPANKTFSSETAIGIGAGSAAGGVALGSAGVALTPMIIKFFSKLF